MRMKKYIQRCLNLPSIKKTIDRNDKTQYCPKIIEESINWLPFLDIMELTADKIDSDKIYYRYCLIVFRCLRLNIGGIQGKMR